MKRPEIRIEDGPLSGKRFAVGAGGLRLGRSSSNDAHIPDEELSRNHCLFEPAGEAGVRLTDLVSANGTFVNGHRLGSESVDLHVGDEILVGATHLRVVDDATPPPAASAGGAVDLGLGTMAGDGMSAAGGAAKSAKTRRAPLANILWGVVIFCLILAAAAIYLMVRSAFFPDEGDGGAAVRAPEKPDVREMSYEKVEGDSASVYRYAMTLTQDGTLTVEMDDVGGENRHLVRSEKLSDTARATLSEILLDPSALALDSAYSGPDTEPPSLKRFELKTVFTDRVRSVTVHNTPEPDAFRLLRERLEAFSMNQLGIRALQYSREKLLEMAAAAAETGRVKWEDRDIAYGNLHASIAAYREAMMDLETVNPKPPVFDGYREAKERAERELAERYKNQRFIAEQATSMEDWEKARRELQVLCEMVPSRDDARYREAAAKLVDVENRIKKGARK